ncbi:MAG TPA: hypothetical protein VFU47_09100 [Armatimonadota bacterium]|nr:hypothetical protein [Armatimonadota bacterium]
MTFEGYVVGVVNPHFSGLATVQVAEKPDAYTTRDPGTIRTCTLEAGAGVRALVRFFGSWDALRHLAPVTRLRFTTSEFSDDLIEGFEPVEEGEG